jgi:CheY-like chemotaxis protein
MSNIKPFGDTAKGLAKNALGIIALFIVLVYGFASLVTVGTGSFTATERLPLIYFLVCFPVLVLGVFTFLVVKHTNKLFGPGDFKNEENFVKMLSAAAFLGVAATKHEQQDGEPQIHRIVEVVQQANPARLAEAELGHNRILWVDDRPDNNIYEREAFSAVGFKFTLALSTEEALEKLKTQRFAAIISDMGRKEGPREGYVLLDELRKTDRRTPFFIYASSRAPEHKEETRRHQGQGCTNVAQELFQMVTRAVLTRSD